MNFLNRKKLILIGASTGGPGLLESIVTALPPKIVTPIIIAQHMDSLSLESFAKRLNRINNITVEFVTQKTLLREGIIYLIGDTFVMQKESGSYFLEPSSYATGFYHPTIDEIFSSVAKFSNLEVHGYLLSGIGADGAKGLLALREAGAKTVAQDEATSIVYGMPKSAVEMGAASKVMSIDKIKEDIDVLVV